MRRIYTNHKLCSGCRACSTACAAVHFNEAAPSRGAIQIHRDPFQGHEYQSVCRQCEDPECVAACMAVALTREVGTGRVVLNRDRCVGCWMCVMVCPHRAIVRDSRFGKAILCDQCEHRETPACVAVCSTGAINYIEVEDTAPVSL